MSKFFNGGNIGKYVDTSSAVSVSGMWNLDSIYVNSSRGAWLTPPGLSYAINYVAITGGSIVNHSTTGDIGSTIDGLSNGDALVLQPGSYSVGLDNVHSSPFRNKNILIVGSGQSASEVVLDYLPDNGGDQRDHPIFDWTGDMNRQIAFLTLFRKPTTVLGTNYSNSLIKGNTAGCYGAAVNVYIGSNNTGVAWIYDNNNYDGNVKWVRCTFADYSSWQSKYTGKTNVAKAQNCLFESTTVAEYSDLGGNVFNATIQADGVYDRNTYSTSGHLYIPETYSQVITS